MNPIVAPICTSIVLLELYWRDETSFWRKMIPSADVLMRLLSEALSTYLGNCLLCVAFFEEDTGCSGGHCRHFHTDNHLAYFPLRLLLLTCSPPQLFHLWSLQVTFMLSLFCITSSLVLYVHRLTVNSNIRITSFFSYSISHLCTHSALCMEILSSWKRTLKSAPNGTTELLVCLTVGLRVFP